MRALICWPGNIVLRSLLAMLPVVIYPELDAIAFMSWAVGALAVANLAAWWFGLRCSAG